MPARSRSGPDLFDDVEMLQTDVMRFFAILCLCLTAIFALVKALPLAPRETESKVVQPADLKDRTESLRKQVAVLEKALLEMQTRLQSDAADDERASARAEQAVKTEKKIQARLAAAKQQLADTSRKLAESRQTFEDRNLALMVLEQDITAKRQIQTELKQRIETEIRDLAQIRTKARKIHGKSAPEIENSPEIEKKQPVEVPATAVASEGFSLRFVSDEALAALIYGGTVKLYALSAHKAWRLMLSGGKPVFTAAEFPRQIYEMEPLTVPAGYVDVFQRQTGTPNPTWGVTLPARTAASIQALISGREGGHLVITSNGEVEAISK